MTVQLDRRTALGAALALGASACAPVRAVMGSTMTEAPVCVLAKEQMRGPYYVDQERVRRDISESLPGLPTTLRIRLIDTVTCAPLVGAAVDIWHCEAGGRYSGFQANNPDVAPSGIVNGSLPQTDQLTYLRGIQITDDEGEVAFKTIFPGWYFGRATHVHMKVHVDAAVGDTLEGGRVCHTGQFFFPEEIAAAIDRIEPYLSHVLVRTKVADDFVANATNGVVPVFDFGPVAPDGTLQSLTGTATVAVDSSATTNPPSIRPPGAPA